MPKHFFVLGLDPLRLSYLQQIAHAEQYEFHELLGFEELVVAKTFDYDAMLHRAQRQIDAFGHPIAGILGHWDFPTSALLPHLCQANGLRSATLEAVLKCEHKYWSRIEQKSVLPQWTPNFCAIDPFSAEPLKQLSIGYPLWLKPIKAHSSFLGFRIESDEEFLAATAEIRERIHRFGNPFDQALAHVDIPDEVRPVGGNWCIAEEILTGKQCGIEGAMLDGEYRVHGIVDTVKDGKNWSFTRYEYPSVWPRQARDKICAAGEELLRHLGYDNAPFGIEFFWNEKTNEFKILEINTRISQSHSDQFIKVHGVSNHQVPVDLALGRVTDLSECQGQYRTAAKFMLRRYRDTAVERVPDAGEIKQLEQAFPDSRIVVTTAPGQQLSDQLVHDSYSYEIANIWLGAESQRELLEKYHRLAEQLKFEFADGAAPETFQFNPVRY